MFKEEVGDITKYKGDVIINSLGVTTTTYGGICGAILRATKSPELKQIIDKVNDVYSVGEYFVTEGYGLADNILHLITPNHDDDKDCRLYKECIRRVLNECKYRKWRKVGIPLIGAGANKYKKDYYCFRELARAG